LKEKKKTHGSLYPLLLKGIAFEFPLKKAPDFLQLTLGFAFLVFKSFALIVGAVEFSFEQVFCKANLGTVGEEKLMAGLINEGVIHLTALGPAPHLHPQGLGVLSGCGSLAISNYARRSLHYRW
jgi:hypothetical protein